MCIYYIIMNIKNATEFYKANLTLRVSDISQETNTALYPITNAIGTINSSRTSYTWFNVNLQDVLGDLYNKFDYFNLRVSAIQGDSGIGSYAVNTLDYNCYFQMSGPTFYNSSYDVATRRTTAQTIISNTIFNRTPFTAYNNDVFVSTFRKQPMVDITIFLLKIVNDLPPATGAGTLFPMMNFYINLIPVENPESKKYLQVY